MIDESNELSILQKIQRLEDDPKEPGDSSLTSARLAIYLLQEIRQLRNQVRQLQYRVAWLEDPTDAAEAVLRLTPGGTDSL